MTDRGVVAIDEPAPTIEKDRINVSTITVVYPPTVIYGYIADSGSVAVGHTMPGCPFINVHCVDVGIAGVICVSSNVDIYRANGISASVFKRSAAIDGCRCQVTPANARSVGIYNKVANAACAAVSTAAVG